MTKAIRVVHFQRRSGPSRFSQERVFAEIRNHFSDDVMAVPKCCPYESSSLVNLARNSLWAKKNAGQANHIVGDVHYLALSLPSSRTILTVHDCVLIVRNRGLRRLIFWLLWYRLPLSRARIITAVSEYTKQQLVRLVKCSSQKIRVIHDPVFRRFPSEKKTFSANGPVLLQVGTGWNKNVSRVSEALKGIRCRLEIVGALDGQQRELLAKFGINYRQHERVSDQRLVALYEECDIVIFASNYEGFGLPIIEAQVTGRPVITSNICSMPEVAGKAACFVSPLDPESIREGILRVIDDGTYRDDLIELGFENAKRFDPAIIARQYAGLYSPLASDIELPQ